MVSLILTITFLILTYHHLMLVFVRKHYVVVLLLCSWYKKGLFYMTDYCCRFIFKSPLWHFYRHWFIPVLPDSLSSFSFSRTMCYCGCGLSCILWFFSPHFIWNKLLTDVSKMLLSNRCFSGYSLGLHVTLQQCSENLREADDFTCTVSLLQHIAAKWITETFITYDYLAKSISDYLFSDQECKDCVD